jgi:hypothetical protein
MANVVVMVVELTIVMAKKMMIVMIRTIQPHLNTEMK